LFFGLGELTAVVFCTAAAKKWLSEGRGLRFVLSENTITLGQRIGCTVSTFQAEG
jgi:hypothetical protein